MFSLIITIISIALIAVLAIASVIYAGKALDNAQSTAKISQTIQEGAQIASAVQVYRVYEGAFPSGEASEIAKELVEKKYLSTIPAGNWIFRPGLAVREDLDADMCQAVNAKLGVEGVPSCSNEDIKGKTVCCIND